jgi:hypothetical protein
MQNQWIPQSVWFLFFCFTVTAIHCSYKQHEFNIDYLTRKYCLYAEQKSLKLDTEMLLRGSIFFVAFPNNGKEFKKEEKKWIALLQSLVVATSSRTWKINKRVIFSSHWKIMFHYRLLIIHAPICWQHIFDLMDIPMLIFSRKLFKIQHSLIYFLNHPR